MVLIIITAGVEMVSVASVWPFLSVLADPDSVKSNQILAMLYEFTSVAGTEQFVIVLGGATFAFILLAAVVRIATNHRINNYVHGSRHTLASRLFARYLAQDYEFFLHRHSSDLAKSILSESDGLVMSYLKPGMDLIAHSALIVALLALLMISSPVPAMAAVVLIGLFYFLTYSLARKKLHQIGTDRLRANQLRYRSITDAGSMIKLIKLHGQESVFLERFAVPSREMVLRTAQGATLTQVPRFIVEALAIGGLIFGITAFMVASDSEGRSALQQLIPLLGLYAFAGYRLIPSAQAVFNAWSSMSLGTAALEEIYSDMTALHAREEFDIEKRIDFHDQIEFDHVCYRYAKTQNKVLRDVNLKIVPGQTVGIQGRTGEGKTTLIDLLLGLITPSEGEIRIDGLSLGPQNVRAWQKALAYVPQEILLVDASVRENIAFGIAATDIDTDRVRSVAKTAGVDEFIKKSLPDGYETLVGERGARLSGGQRQRIGIARALYRQPSVLVLDEATSALDSQTESCVLKALSAGAHELTILMISHRNETLAACDSVFLVQNGSVLIDQ